MQNEIIRVLDPAAVMPDDQLTGDEGEVFTWRFGDSRQEAEYLANLIGDWIGKEQLAPAEIAVLVSKQLDLYADHLMAALEARGIPFRNEQQMQDITTEPAARLIVDYLSCLYDQRKPKAWIRLMNQLTPFADEETQSNARKDLDRLIKHQRKEAAIADQSTPPFSGWWEFVRAFLNQIGIGTLVALSPDYESHDRLKEVVRDTKARVEELLKLEPDLPKALARFSDDQAVRILTIHKSKGLEFDSVIILGLEDQTFWGKADEERCAFFVAVSRAKRRLVLTISELRETPPSNPYRWREQRSQHDEFVGYALPFLSQHQ
jgi:superfamily I DNA/RNA helicase